MNKVISEDLLDKEGYIITEKLDSFMGDNNPAQSILIGFLKNEIEEFFRTLPIGLGIVLDLIVRDLGERKLIQFLNRFNSLELIIPSLKNLEEIKLLKTILANAVDRGTSEAFHEAKLLIEKNCKLFPLLYKKAQSTYRVNSFITLKLENNQTNIYVKNEKRNFGVIVQISKHGQNISMIHDSFIEIWLFLY